MVQMEVVGREALEAADEKIMAFQRTMEKAARTGALDPEELERFGQTIKEAAARVNDQVLPHIDPTSAQEIGTRLISILTLDVTTVDTLDAADSYLIDLEAIRHVFRDLLEEQRPESLRREAQELVALIEGWLPDVSVQDRADLLGFTPRQLQRRRHDNAPATSREQLVARLIAILRGGWTDAGVMAWFRRPRAELHGAAPIDLLADPSQEPALLLSARAGRVQGGI